MIEVGFLSFADICWSLHATAAPTLLTNSLHRSNYPCLHCKPETFHVIIIDFTLKFMEICQFV